MAWHDSTANTLNIQVNNGTVDSIPWTTGVLNGSSPFAIGTRSDTLPLYFDGRIDEVGFWKRLLSSSERSSLYNSGSGWAYPFSSCPSTVGSPTTGQTWGSYYYAGTRRTPALAAGASVAERVLTATGARSDTLYDLQSDYLGSTSRATCASTGAASACATLGQVIDRENYYPFGSARSGGASLPTDFRFTGQRQQATLGIYDFVARFCDPTLGRFLSANTIVPGSNVLAVNSSDAISAQAFGDPKQSDGPDSPQRLNRYTYVLNNPVIHNDPTGHIDSCGGEDEPPCSASSGGEFPGVQE